MSAAVLMTAEQFAQMQTPETEDYELVDGELIRLSSATPKHAKIRQLLEVALAVYFERTKGGSAYAEVDCRLAEYTVRRPDVLAFLGERSEAIDQNRIPVPLAPDIAVEVLSPSESAVDVNRKVLDYLNAGSREVWIVDHANREFFVHSESGIRLLRDGDALTTDLLSGFSEPVSRFFGDA